MNNADKARIAETAFHARVAELGGVVVEPTWLGANDRHRVRCAMSHVNSVRPANVRKGTGICRTCAGRDPAAANAAFRARVAELGGTVLEPAWLGSDVRHRARCAVGHECSPRPTHIQRGNRGLCPVCSGRDPATAESAFRARVAELGGAVLEPTWLGVHVPHRINCAAGHIATPRPHNVFGGSGLCRICKGMVFDAFYLVKNHAAYRLKFGITSGSPRPRLRTHENAGYTDVARVLIGLPADQAPAMERSCLRSLARARFTPVRGREYFSLDALPIVLDVMAGYDFPGPDITATMVIPS